MVSKAYDRANSRRPITDDEVPYLEAMGHELRLMRLEAGLTQRALGERAGFTGGYVQMLEHGVRRPRATAIYRLAGAAVEAQPLLGPVDELVELLLDTAGPAIAPASTDPAYIERMLAARKKREETMQRYIDMAVRKGLVRRLKPRPGLFDV